MNLLIIDNYDSFTYNLVQYFRELPNVEVSVYRNDKIQIAEIAKYDAIVLSPGPGIPSEAGRLLDIIRAYTNSKPILGICLGHQAIAEVLGGELVNLSKVHHGVASPMNIDLACDLLQGLPSPFQAGRYHSWAVSKERFPSCLEITASDDSGQIMALRHKTRPIFGLQFHPESVLTPKGKTIIENFIKICREQANSNQSLANNQ